MSKKSDSLIAKDSVVNVAKDSLSKSLEVTKENSVDESGKKDLVENKAQTEQENGNSQKIVEVTIVTEPPEAAVVFNDSVIGLSPVTITDVLAGKHSLVLKKKGCYMRKIAFQIDSSTTFNFTLNRPGSIYFTSEPSGAQIFVNGKPKKVTPFIDSTVKPGDYTVRAELEGYGFSERKITVSSGAEDTLKFVLEPPKIKTDTTKSIQKQEIDPKKKKRVRTIVIAGIFALFGVVLILMESFGEK